MYNKRKHKLFVNLEKQRGIQGQIQQFIVTEKETSDEKRINTDIELFFKNLFLKKKNVKKSSAEHTTFLDTLSLPILNESKTLLCKGALTEKEQPCSHDKYGPRKSI